MNNLPKNLQQNNFLDIMKKMINVPGWEVLEESDILAMKSGSDVPLINFVWGAITQENLSLIETFYKSASFYWLLNQNQNDRLLINAEFEGPSESPEMVFFVDQYIEQVISPSIRIVQISSDSELDLWTETASKTFGLSSKGLKNFFEPLIGIAKVTPFLLYYDEKPAATSLVYVENNIAGIYAMSTLETFRRKGLGTAAVQACLSYAKKNNASYAVLYASPMGKLLYKNMGLHVVQVLKEYFRK